MTNPDELKATVKVCMFDQYGTVVDMQTGLVEAATPFLRAKGWHGSANSFVTWWRRTHFENSMIDALLHKQHTPYREIGERSVANVMDRAGIVYTMDEVRALVDHIVRLRPFPEVPAALDRLRARYRLVVLSNGDPDMLENAKDTTASHSNGRYRSLLRIRSSRMSRPILGRRRYAACEWTRCCSSPIMRSTASARSQPACARRSSTGASVRSARHHTSPICLCAA